MTIKENDLLTWEADYGESSLTQYNEDGTENKYTDIIRHSLKRFILQDERGVRFVLNLDPGKRLVYRRRVSMNLMSKVKDTIHIFGYQEHIRNGFNKQVIFFYFESTGRLEITDGFKEGHRWFYPVKFLDVEA